MGGALTRDDVKTLKNTHRLALAETRAAYRLCFWTWPWGHLWGDGHGGRYCLICKKPAPTGDGG